jgi:hypothetical protein
MTDPKHDPKDDPKPQPAKGDPSRAGDLKSINEPPGSQVAPPPVPPVVEVPEQHKGEKTPEPHTPNKHR